MLQLVLFISLGVASGVHLIRNQNPIRDHYIIRLNANVNLHQHLEELQNALGNEMQIQYVYENLGQELGYSSKLTPRALEILLQIDSIKYVEEDQIAMHADCKTQKNTGLWGLLRSSNRNYTDGYDSQDRYQYDYTTSKTGLGVDAYILDTGIYCEHEEFTKKADGTCSFGYSSVKDGSGNIDESDGNGHGTHVAGTVGGIHYGVAKECNLIAVKVLDDNGYGPWSGVISGIDWVIGQVNANKKPSVANLSLGGSKSQSVNDAVNALVAAGCSCFVAAGNNAADACNYTPASAADAITVAASDRFNHRADYSNYGECCDIVGPGTDIYSAWISDPTSSKELSGTSQATPHVCGTAAKFLSANHSLTPNEIRAKLIAEASVNELDELLGTPNLMVYGSAQCENNGKSEEAEISNLTIGLITAGSALLISMGLFFGLLRYWKKAPPNEKESDQTSIVIESPLAPSV